MKLSDDERLAYENYMDDLHYQASMFHSSYTSGHIDGRKEGRAETTIRIAEQMKKNGESMEKIAQYTGLSLAEIEQL
jgi:predicted transposase/invertase (TIGR01784 family)